MKNIFLVFVFGSLLFPQQLKSSPDTLKKSEEVVQETTNPDTSLSEEPTKIEIVKIPGTPWWESTLFIGIGGIILGGLIAYFTQNFLTNKQSKYQRKETWLNEFMSYSTEFAIISYYYRMEIVRRFKDLEEPRKQIGFFSTELFFTITRELTRCITRIYFLINQTNEDEKNLYTLIAKYQSVFKNITQQKGDINELDKQANQLETEITNASEKIIFQKKAELKKH